MGGGGFVCHKTATVARKARREQRGIGDRGSGAVLQMGDMGRYR